jgi:hypothetical protein
MGYFASRAAPMGPVPAEVVIATFFNFSPALVRRAIPAAWELASPTTVHAARLEGISDALRNVLGEALDGPDVEEAVALARTAADGARPDGRPLYAAHASLDWPESPHLALWWALTLLREHRGDGHVAVLVERGLTGCEALVLHAATGEVPAAILQSTRARTDDEWHVAVESLCARGWLDPDGELSETGRDARAELELRTDQLAMGPWERLGEAGALRLREIVRPLSRAIVETGAFGR